MEILIVLAVVAWLAYACTVRANVPAVSADSMSADTAGMAPPVVTCTTLRLLVITPRTVPHKIPGWAACRRPSLVFFFRYQRLRRRR